MTGFADEHKERFRVEPICRALQAAPSTYYAARQRRPSTRRVRDEALKVKLAHVHAEHFGVYGARKLWRQLSREGIPVARLMRELGGLDVGRIAAGTTHGAQRPAPYGRRGFEPRPRAWPVSMSSTHGRPPPGCRYEPKSPVGRARCRQAWT